MKLRIGCVVFGMLSSLLSLSAQTSGSSSTSSQLLPAPAERTASLLSRRGVPVGEKQPSLSQTSPAAIKDSSPLVTCTFGLIDFPRSNSSTALGIDDRGKIVGGYDDSNVDSNVPGDDAFLLSGNTFSSLAFPGAVQTAAYWGEIVPGYVDGAGMNYGF